MSINLVMVSSYLYKDLKIGVQNWGLKRASTKVPWYSMLTLKNRITDVTFCNRHVYYKLLSDANCNLRSFWNVTGINGNDWFNYKMLCFSTVIVKMDTPIWSEFFQFFFLKMSRIVYIKEFEADLKTDKS